MLLSVSQGQSTRWIRDSALDDEFANKIVRMTLEEIEHLRLSEEKVRIVITGGPSSEPIDQVRVITNRSTGELAVTLARRAAASGHRVELLLGQGAIFRSDAAKYFGTNEDLLRLLGGVVTARTIPSSTRPHFRILVANQISRNKQGAKFQAMLNPFCFDSFPSKIDLPAPRIV
jgi:hypothetical protein